MRLSVRNAYWLVTSLNWFAAVLPMPVMVLLAQSRGVTLAEVGLYMGVYALVVAALEVPSGAVADAMGRKRAYLLGGALTVVARLVYLAAFDLWAFVLFAALFGAARALTSGALEAWFVDALQAEDEGVDLQPALATAGSFQLAALALGTLGGGALPALFARLPEAGAVTPLAVPLLVSALLQVLVLALAAAVVVERRPAAAGSLSTAVSPLAVVALVRQAFVAVARAPRLRLLLAADVVVGAALAASENLWQPFFAALLPGDGAAVAAGGGTLALGAILGGSFAVGILGNLLATRLAAALGRRHALVAALFQLAQGAAFVLLALAGGFVAAAALFLGTYLARAALSSPHMALYNREVTADRRSVMLSVQSLASFAGAFVGSVALGPLAEAASIATAWAVAGAAVAATSLLYLRLDREARRERGAAYRGTKLSVVDDM